LNDLFWQRVSDVLSERGLVYGDLWEKVQRNKNTYTNWRKKRTIPQISDLEEIALALRVAPGDLLRPSGGHESAVIGEQLELPFEPGRKGASLELEYTAAGFVLKLPRKAG
jgi:transcriptional regulator with XRE-family HTH domain